MAARTCGGDGDRPRHVRGCRCGSPCSLRLHLWAAGGLDRARLLRLALNVGRCRPPRYLPSKINHPVVHGGLAHPWVHLKPADVSHGDEAPADAGRRRRASPILPLTLLLVWFGRRK